MDSAKGRRPASAGPFTASANATNSDLSQAIEGLSKLETEIERFVAEELSAKAASPDSQSSSQALSSSSKTSDASASPTSDTTASDPSRHRDPIHQSVTLIHSLLQDTQFKCQDLISSNVSVGQRLDGRLDKCQSDMDHLRKELAYAHRCVSDMEVNAAVVGSATESDTEAHAMQEREMEVTVQRLRAENERLGGQVQLLQSEVGSLRETLIEAAPVLPSSTSSHQLGRAHGHPVPRLQHFPPPPLDSPSGSPVSASLREELGRLEEEVRRSHEALTALKIERKRLRSEKAELAGQVREASQRLEAKEHQLRSFVLRYEAAMREREAAAASAHAQRHRAEVETQRMAATLHDSEAALAQLRDHLAQRDRHNHLLTHQLHQLHRRLRQEGSLDSSSGVSDQSPSQLHSARLTATTPGSQGYASLPVSPGDDDLPASAPTPTPDATRQPAHNRVSVLEQAKELALADDTVAEEDDEAIPPVILRARKGGRSQRSRSSDGSRLSRIFRLSRSKSKDEAGPSGAFPKLPSSQSCDPRATLCVEEDLVDRDSFLAEARKLPLLKWKQAHLLAWLELEMGFPGHIVQAFRDNVKSGRVLLSLSEEDMEECLGISSPLAQKKLKLAIADYGAPSLAPYPLLRELDHEYVAGPFLASCGLSQYAPAFRAHLVDGRVATQLTKKEMEKQLGMRKRMHQNSLLRGLELLRVVGFDTAALAKRRLASSAEARDLLVWSNQRLAAWLRSVDLAELADNLAGTGIHGALAVLERSFTAETLAGSLGIPSTKRMLRKHLCTEFSGLLFEARAQLHSARNGRLAKSTTFGARASLPRSAARSVSPAAKAPPSDAPKDSKDSPRRLGIKSFGRMLGLRRSLIGRPTELRSPSPLRLPLQKIAPPSPPPSTQRSLLSAAADGDTLSSSATSDLGSSIERPPVPTHSSSHSGLASRPPPSPRVQLRPKAVRQQLVAAPRPHSIAVSKPVAAPEEDGRLLPDPCAGLWLPASPVARRLRNIGTICEQREGEHEAEADAEVTRITKRGGLGASPSLPPRLGGWEASSEASSDDATLAAPCPGQPQQRHQPHHQPHQAHQAHLPPFAEPETDL